MHRPGFALLGIGCVLLITGCAGSAPEGTGTPSSVWNAPPSVDSVERDPAEEDVASSAARSENGIASLRTAYLEARYEEVVRRAQKRLRDSLLASEAIQLHTLLGRAQQARGRHEAAIKALRLARVKLVETDQSVVHIDRALGESFADLYRWPRATSAFRRVLDARPDDRRVRAALAEVYRRSQRWKEAQRHYRRLIRSDSSNGRWWARLAECDLELHETEEATRHFAEAHRLLPQSAEIALSLSRLYRATDRLEAARSVVDTSLSYQAGDPRLWRRRADLAFEQEDLEVARRAYRRTIAVGDSSATPFRRIGLIDVKRQQYTRALSSLRQSLRRNALHPRTTLYLGISYLKVDSLEQATKYLQQTIDREAKGPITRALAQRAAARNRRGDVAGAVQSYKTALRLQPDRTEVYFRLATVYDEHYEEKSTAARYYRIFLQASDSTQSQLRSYARSRLEALRPTLHMEEAPSTSDTSDGP